MDTNQEQAAARGRFKNVVQASQLPESTWARETGKYGAAGREAAPALGAQGLGYALVSLDPGRRSCPFHFHYSEEEMFYVLSGAGVLRQGKEGEKEEELELAPGDFVSFPAGTGIAHQFINRTEEPFVYLAVSNIVKGDVCVYPDSDKILFRGARTMVRRSPVLEYFDGEL